MDNIKILNKKDPTFPKNFLLLKDCPEFLFVRGNEKILNDYSLAIVGSRTASYEFRNVAKEMARNFSLNNIVVVSGLAHGIDSEAHKSAVDVNGKTIAVLGNGIDKIYPRENNSLAEKIIEKGGAIISEYFPGVEPLPVNLHRRNRLIAALANATIIIEAGRKSGSLITAKYAKKQGKELYVVPGGVNDLNFEGSNQLLIDGAKCVRNAWDIYEKLEDFKNKKIKKKGGEIIVKPKIDVSEDNMIFSCITKKGVSFQEICESSMLPAKDILTQLTLLEVSGCIKKVDNKFFKI